MTSEVEATALLHERGRARRAAGKCMCDTSPLPEARLCVALQQQPPRLRQHPRRRHGPWEDPSGHHLPRKLREEGRLAKKKALIVVPTSLLSNWQEEIARFAPLLTVFLYYGAKRDLADFHGDILLTTYGLFEATKSFSKRRNGKSSSSTKRRTSRIPIPPRAGPSAA